MFSAEIASFKKRPHLCEEARVEHRAEAPFDSGVQIAAFKGGDRKFCYLHVCKHRHSLLLQSRDGFAGEPIDLECALDTLRIVDVDARGGGRIHLLELAVQGSPP